VEPFGPRLRFCVTPQKEERTDRDDLALLHEHPPAKLPFVPRRGLQRRQAVASRQSGAALVQEGTLIPQALRLRRRAA
jgi:hypothetical protein